MTRVNQVSDSPLITKT